MVLERTARGKSGLVASAKVDVKNPIQLRVKVREMAMAFIIQRMELTSYSWEIPCPVIFFQRTWQVVLPVV